MFKMLCMICISFLLSTNVFATENVKQDEVKSVKTKNLKKTQTKKTNKTNQVKKQNNVKSKQTLINTKAVDLKPKDITHPNIKPFEVNNYINGFRDIKFGSYINDLTNRVELDNANGIRCFKKSNENLKFYNVDLELIVYCYNTNDKLFLIELISKYDNVQSIKANFEQYIRNFQNINDNQSVILQYKSDVLERAILLTDRNEELKSFFLIDFNLAKNIYSF